MFAIAARILIGVSHFFYSQVCADARSASGVRNKVQLTFSSKHCAMLTYNPSTKRAFVYDNEDALALKVNGSF